MDAQQRAAWLAQVRLAQRKARDDSGTINIPASPAVSPMPTAFSDNSSAAANSIRTEAAHFDGALSPAPAGQIFAHHVPTSPVVPTTRNVPGLDTAIPIQPNPQSQKQKAEDIPTATNSISSEPTHKVMRLPSSEHSRFKVIDRIKRTKRTMQRTKDAVSTDQEEAPEASDSNAAAMGAVGKLRTPTIYVWHKNKRFRPKQPPKKTETTYAAEAPGLPEYPKSMEIAPPVGETKPSGGIEMSSSTAPKAGQENKPVSKSTEVPKSRAFSEPTEIPQPEGEPKVRSAAKPSGAFRTDKVSPSTTSPNTPKRQPTDAPKHTDAGGSKQAAAKKGDEQGKKKKPEDRRDFGRTNAYTQTADRKKPSIADKKVKKAEKATNKRPKRSVRRIGKSRQLQDRLHALKVEEGRQSAEAQAVNSASKALGMVYSWFKDKAVRVFIKSATPVVLAAGIIIVLAVVVCVIGIMLTPFGIFFAEDAADHNLSKAVREINRDYMLQMQSILDENDDVDTSQMYGENPVWKEVLTVYAADMSISDEPEKIMDVTPAQKRVIKDLFEEMNQVEYEVSVDYIPNPNYVPPTPNRPPKDPNTPGVYEPGGTTTVNTTSSVPKYITKKTLVVIMRRIPMDTMIAQRDYDEDTIATMHEMISPDYDADWNAILYGMPIASLSDWCCPLDEYIQFTDKFGMRIHPITHEYKAHNAIDVAAEAGTPIRAAKAGTVTYSRYNDSLGNYVIIDHHDGFETWYAHMVFRNIEYGEEVQQGQVIGFVGSTGESTGPHLHYVVKYNGEYIDPEYYFLVGREEDKDG